ncbi:hypothetical protein IC582_001466 [Cucumis melo]
MEFRSRHLISPKLLLYCYDPLDPNGNITITYDIQTWTTRGYVGRVTIQNYYQFRHVENPGWKLAWTWTRGEVIWSMNGAFATEQGNCSLFKFDIPHSCEERPVILDLMPEASLGNRSEGCCRSGVLSAWAVDRSKSFSSFEISVGSKDEDGNELPPANITLMAPGPGYTCSPFLDSHPTVSSVIDGKREVQVFRTWKSTCTYSIFVDNKTPVCCVSLSAFYNPSITPCPSCSCGCRKANKSSVQCTRDEYQLSSSDSATNLSSVRCSDHMCPVRVHWHVETNYINHWRVKLTVSNYNYNRNYSNWNILVQHPGFGQSTEAFSFNSSQLPSLRYGDELALFWGIENFNTELVQSTESNMGYVTTDILFEKDLESFTLSNGWALPRRVYFNGDNCHMPLPDTFPMLPNGNTKQSLSLYLFILLFFFDLFVLVKV